MVAPAGYVQPGRLRTEPAGAASIFDCRVAPQVTALGVGVGVGVGLGVGLGVGVQLRCTPESSKRMTTAKTNAGPRRRALTTFDGNTGMP
jgi:hypothetical protein